MTMLTHTISVPRSREAKTTCRFSLFALLLSFGLAMLGLASVTHPQPGAATGDPFLFVMRP